MADIMSLAEAVTELVHDGDTVGECSEMLAEIRPGALKIRMPG